MRACIRPTAVLSMAVGLAFVTPVFAQNGTTKLPTDPSAVPSNATHGDHHQPIVPHGDLKPNMEADEIIAKQLSKCASMPNEAGDSKFALKAGCGNLAEVEFSKVVAAKASDPQVKALAEMMVKEHGMAQEKLAPIGAKLGVTYPSNLPTEKQLELNFLSGLTPDKMEKAYLSMMKSDHLATVNMYTDHVPMIKDPDLKAYAEETLAKVRAHTAEVLKVSAAKGLPVDLKFDGAMPADHKM